MALTALPAWPHAVLCRRRGGRGVRHSSTLGGRRRHLSAAAGGEPLDGPISDPLLRVAVREPLAFVGGLFAGASLLPFPVVLPPPELKDTAGLLKLDLKEDPLKEWVSTTASSAGAAETQLPVADEAPPAAAPTPEAAPTDS